MTWPTRMKLIKLQVDQNFSVLYLHLHQNALSWFISSSPFSSSDISASNVLGNFIPAAARAKRVEIISATSQLRMSFAETPKTPNCMLVFYFGHPWNVLFAGCKRSQLNSNIYINLVQWRSTTKKTPDSHILTQGMMCTFHHIIAFSIRCDVSNLRSENCLSTPRL